MIGIKVVTRAWIGLLALASACSGGTVSIQDDHEIRIRYTAEDWAENYRIHTSADYTAYKYTSTCSPAGF